MDWVVEVVPLRNEVVSTCTMPEMRVPGQSASSVQAS
jgi:hypothetical protein